MPKSTEHLEKGKYGPIFPKTPACYGFTVIAKVKPGRADAIRAYGQRLAAALEADPFVLAPLKLHYLRKKALKIKAALTDCHALFTGKEPVDRRAPDITRRC
jgi:hypothetical protein